MRCRTSSRGRFRGQLGATGCAGKEIGVRSSWRYVGLGVFCLQLRLFFECPAIRVILLLSLRHPSPLSCWVRNGQSVVVESMSYIHHWNLKSWAWLGHLLLRLRKRLLRFWVILMLLASCLQRILVIIGLREAVWYRWG